MASEGSKPQIADSIKTVRRAVLLCPSMRLLQLRIHTDATWMTRLWIRKRRGNPARTTVCAIIVKDGRLSTTQWAQATASRPLNHDRHNGQMNARLQALAVKVLSGGAASHIF